MCLPSNCGIYVTPDKTSYKTHENDNGHQSRSVCLAWVLPWWYIFQNSLPFFHIQYLQIDAYEYILSVQLGATMGLCFPCGHQLSWYVLLLFSFLHVSCLFLTSKYCIQIYTGLLYGCSNLVCYFLNFVWWCYRGLWSSWWGNDFQNVSWLTFIFLSISYG